MSEWLLLRLMMLGAMVGGGVLIALAGGLLDGLRERRARVRNGRQRETLAAEYRADPVAAGRRQERRALASGGRGGIVASMNHRPNLAAVVTLRSSAQ
jgi:hypothetical protein